LRLAAGLAAFLLALLAKETAVALPLLFALHEGLAPEPRRLAPRPAMRRLLPWLSTLGLYLGLRAWALGGLVAHGRPGGSPLIAADLFARYLATLFVPLDLSIGHFVPAPETWASPRGLFAIASLLAIASLAWAGWRFHRGLLLAVALFGLTLAPALALAGFGPRLSKLYSDRYLYLPSAGWALGVGMALALVASRAGRRHRLVWIAAAAAGLALAATTVRQNRVWRTELTLWTDAVRKYPADGMNHLDLGRALLAAGDAEAARRAFARATTVDPGLVDFHLQQGRAFLQAGLPLRAILAFDSAMAIAPDSFEALLGAADASNAAGWHDLAARRYLAAIARRPDSSAARNGYGYLLARAGRLDEAIVQFESAAAAAPRDPVPLRNLAAVWERRGDAARAAELRARADALAPR
jgi:tetratricopeptide (TPR) repeat protein